ncbi:hypothetical protein FIV00_14960 [Labrenzia sp. THAF82]|uniref:hypothetical protein n=1 Tax=Labrenzia sp. THAF82 TaxID=2587861 RepID=UPI001268CF0D|nr:hypothetical protein [Labrenzia sp. THAF82]QFT31790.1 hypothetical protein FIV00_14960 [Labrenzia sp. THAF82]
MSAEIRKTLRVYSWARGQHRLRGKGAPVSFAAIAEMISADTGLPLTTASAALAGGFSSKDTQARLAAWNGLKLAQKHGQPVLVVDPTADFDPGSVSGAGRGLGAGAAPISIEDARRRVDGRSKAA